MYIYTDIHLYIAVIVCNQPTVATAFVTVEFAQLIAVYVYACMYNAFTSNFPVVPLHIS